MATDGWGTESGASPEGNPEGGISGAWEFLPPQVRFVFIGVIFVMLAFVAVGVGDAFSSLGGSMESYRESLGGDIPRRYTAADAQEEFQPRKVRKESGIFCSIFGGLLRKPQSCE